MKSVLALLVTFALNFDANAFGYVYVTNMGHLSWQLASDGRVYLRNLNQFDASFMPCCYNYWVDTNTPSGKAMWGAMLLKIGTEQPLYLGLSNPSLPGQIEQIGNW
jgi:hypothetical protein